MNYKLQLEDIAHLLPTPEGKHFITGMAHGTMSMELYKPDKIDPQTPHEQDEIYVILRGSGTFFVNGERMPFKEKDVLFVPAGVEHRFENFTDDFMTWVIFYGQKGGEKQQFNNITI
jgi:mannose-6-phosphate isomerase-like protein (cupin superfamily)